MHEVKFRAHIEAKLKRLVPALDDRIDVEKLIRFVLGNDPQWGEDTGRTASFPIYAIRMYATNTRPPLTVYYTFSDKIALVVDLRIAARDSNDPEQIVP